MFVSEPSKPVADVIGPEPVEPQKRLIHPAEFVAIDTADRLDITDVLFIEITHHAMNFTPQRGEANPDRATIDA